MTKKWMFLALLSLSPSLWARPSIKPSDKLKIVEVRSTVITNDVDIQDVWATNQVEDQNCDVVSIVKSDRKENKTNDIGFGDIVQIGEKIWQIVKDNKPVWENKSLTASALPQETTCWSALSGWKRKQKTIELVAKNGFGAEVVKFRYALIFYYGGNYEKKGKYIAQATALPLKVNVVWGYNFSSEVSIPSIQNLGSEKEPVAGMELRVNWKIKTPVKIGEGNDIFLISGDGSLETP